MGAEKEVIVDIGGKRYPISSDDTYIDHMKDGFEPDMVRLFQSTANHSNTILDIGANIGCTAILFGTLANTVHAFEPSVTTFAFLKKNVTRSGLGNVSLHNIGLGAESGELTLTFAPSNRSGGFVSNQTQASAGHVIENIVIRRLDDVVDDLDLRGIDFIKIDVEGFEGHVLRGGTRTLSSFHPLVVLELNHWCLNAFQRTSVPDFFDLLRSLFPIVLAVDGSNYQNLHDPSESYIVMYHHILQMRFTNVLCAFDESRLKPIREGFQHHFPV